MNKENPRKQGVFNAFDDKYRKIRKTVLYSRKVIFDLLILPYNNKFSRGKFGKDDFGKGKD